MAAPEQPSDVGRGVLEGLCVGAQTGGMANLFRTCSQQPGAFGCRLVRDPVTFALRIRVRNRQENGVKTLIRSDHLRGNFESRSSPALRPACSRPAWVPRSERPILSLTADTFHGLCATAETPRGVWRESNSQNAFA